jgi:alpha-tubulin suppressor-like RCC1 family protein
VGRDYACGLTNSGDAYCWGNGNTGQLGAGDTLSTVTPVAVKGGVKFVQLEAGYGTTCGLTAAGKGWCWGRNDLGQLGLGNSGGQLGDQSVVPVEVGDPLSTVVLKQIVTRGPKTCAITEAGAAYCWGNNTVFELGTTTNTTTCFGFKPCSLTPLPVSSSANFKFLSATQFATCGLTVSNGTLCWGLDFENILGASETVPSCATSGTIYGCTAKPLAGPVGFLTLTGARSNYCGMRADGIAYCWGGNEFGQRGTEGSTADPTPRVFSISPALPP